MASERTASQAPDPESQHDGEVILQAENLVKHIRSKLVCCVAR